VVVIGKDKKKSWEERKKSIAKVQKAKSERMKQVDKFEGEDKLVYDIGLLENRISSTKYDLTHWFKGNTVLKRKLELMEQVLCEKQQELETLVNSNI